MPKIEQLDFDNHEYHDDDNEWWRQQDEDMQQKEELERIENQADEDYLRRFGYWD